MSENGTPAGQLADIMQRGWQSYLNAFRLSPNEQSGATGLPQRYAEFLRDEAAPALQKMSQLSLDYYREVWNVGLNLSQNFYRNLFAITTETTAGQTSAAERELAFEGPAGSAVTQTFLVSNTTDQAALMSFELSEFVNAEGDKVRVEALLAPDAFELAPRGQRAVECTLPLTAAFQTGKEYRAVLRVIGFPQMQVSLRACVSAPAAEPKKPAAKKRPRRRARAKSR